MITPAWAKLATVAALMAASYYMGYDRAATSEQLDSARAANSAWIEHAALAGRLLESDRKLAEAQALIIRGVAVEVTKREVIYRDRIKDPATAKCVADSGLLELIDAANGIGSTKR